MNSVLFSSQLWLWLVGEYSKALQQCEQVVSYLVMSLQQVPFHPLLGLQLFTLGAVLLPKDDLFDSFVVIVL